MADTSDLSRRHFLQTGALVAGGAAAGLTPLAALAARPAASHVRRLTPVPKLKGRWIRPEDMGYAMAAWPNNARWTDARPLAIAMCANDEDVRLSIVWAQENSKPFAIRSGGHSYAGFSTTNGVLIDVKPMNGVTPDWKKGTVFVQGGASNQDVANALRSRPFAVPSGRCPTVGTSGLVLGGGWGFGATHSGLTCDSLAGTDIVLASGTRVRADASNLDDLFWAVRGGGGGNFGVNTSFTFNLVEVSDVTTFNIVWPPGKQIELMMSLQKMQLDNPRTISTRTKVRPTRAGARPERSQLVVETLGLYWGKEKQLRQILADTFAIQQPDPATTDIYEMDYWRARDYLLTDDPVGMYDLKSSYVENRLGGDGLEMMLSWMSQWPGGSLRQDNMGILFAIGGAVKDKKIDETAYVHRNSNYIFEMETAWGPIDDDSVVRAQGEWLSNYYNAMQKFVQQESYVNFPNRELTNWARKYYGTNLERLSEIKSRYDPHDAFKFLQSIPLKKPASV
jgi:hypothetical protein